MDKGVEAAGQAIFTKIGPRREDNGGRTPSRAVELWTEIVTYSDFSGVHAALRIDTISVVIQ